MMSNIYEPLLNRSRLKLFLTVQEGDEVEEEKTTKKKDPKKSKNLGRRSTRTRKHISYRWVCRPGGVMLHSLSHPNILPHKQGALKCVLQV